MADLSDRRTEPARCRAMIFLDGQNLYRSAQRAFGLPHPTFDPMKLGAHVCRGRNWDLGGIRLYTGIPPVERSPFWHHFWSRKKTQLMRRGIICNTRPTVCRSHVIQLPDGTRHTGTIEEEKGIDVWIAVDLISLAYQDQYDVAVIFSQDQDLRPAVDEAGKTAKRHARWIKFVSAFPDDPRNQPGMGIRDTEYLPIQERDFRACLDDYDYVSRAAEDAARRRR